MAILLCWIGCQRFIYNSKVGENRYFRAFAGKFLSNTGLFAPIDQQYSQFKSELTPWLNEVPSQVLRNGAYQWAQAYQRYFKGLGGRPVLKRKHGKLSVWLTKELFEFIELTNPVTQLRGVAAVLSGAIVIKERKRASIRKKVGVECSEPVEAIPPTYVEIAVSRLGSQEPSAAV